MHRDRKRGKRMSSGGEKRKRDEGERRDKKESRGDSTDEGEMIEWRRGRGGREKRRSMID